MRSQKRRTRLRDGRRRAGRDAFSASVHSDALPPAKLGSVQPKSLTRLLRRPDHRRLRSGMPSGIAPICACSTRMKRAQLGLTHLRPLIEQEPQLCDAPRHLARISRIRIRDGAMVPTASARPAPRLSNPVNARGASPANIRGLARWVPSECFRFAPSRVGTWRTEPRTTDWRSQDASTRVAGSIARTSQGVPEGAIRLPPDFQQTLQRIARRRDLRRGCNDVSPWGGYPFTRDPDLPATEADVWQPEADTSTVVLVPPQFSQRRMS
jgi:hypothetical protein